MMKKESKKELAEPKAKPAAAAAAADVMIEAMVDGVGVCDFEGRIIQANKACAELYGFKSADEVIGRRWPDFIAKRELPKAMETFKESMEKGFLKNFETVFVRIDGSEVPVMLNATVLKDTTGKPVGVIAVIRDITELKRLQEKEKQTARAEEAEKYSKELEAKVKELEKFHDLTVGRELKMKKMEEEMEELKKKFSKGIK